MYCRININHEFHHSVHHRASEATTGSIKQEKNRTSHLTKQPQRNRTVRNAEKRDPYSTDTDRINRWSGKKTQDKMGACKCLMSLVVVLALTMSLAEAQSGTSATCAQELIPCMDYLNSTSTPPSSCCDPLKRTVETELTCLCNLFYTPGLLQTFNISVDNALALSRRCGVTSDLTSCNNGTYIFFFCAYFATPFKKFNSLSYLHTHI